MAIHGDRDHVNTVAEQLRAELSHLDVATPLRERPASSVAALTDVLRWRRQAQDLACSVGSKFVEIDGGPGLGDLLGELEWFLDDSVAGYGDFEGKLDVQSCSWREVKDRLHLWVGNTCEAVDEEPHSNSHDSISNDKQNLKLSLRMSLSDMEKEWKERIFERKPIQYVVSAARWRGMVLVVMEGVLIPRVETEQLIDLAKFAISSDRSLADGLWVDLGSGSGAIAVGLASLLGPSGCVMAIDASTAALAVTEKNVERCGVQDKVQVVQGFWFSPLESRTGEVAGIVSNPPYIPTSRLAAMRAEAGKHEPRMAMDGGSDGADHLRTVCDGSAVALRSGGFLALETNGGPQAGGVQDYVRKMSVLDKAGKSVHCFQNVKCVEDYAGVRRFVVATRR